MSYKLEVIAFNIASCFIAQQNGADRVELCQNPGDGGTTPPYGFIHAAREVLQVELFPIIRPRGGDFMYSDQEYGIMKKDITLCKQAGCDGVVIGMLNTDGTIEKNRAAKLAELAYPMSVTFHRAFDRTADPYAALEDIVDIGCERILTSGLQPTALEGIDVIRQLVEQADHRIIIMPGSAVRSSNIEMLLKESGAAEFHTSARRQVASSMEYVNADMQEALADVQCDGEEVKRIAAILKNL